MHLRHMYHYIVPRLEYLEKRELRWEKKLQIKIFGQTDANKVVLITVVLW